MLTVLLATRNRASILRETLEAFCRLEPPSSGWKLVIADNGSTDETPEVLRFFEDRLPLRTVAEPTGGKNSALNAGLRFVEGDLVVFTDDDVFPHSDWLVELRKAADAQPEYSVFGGAILPRWESPPPHWVEWVEQGPVYTLTDPMTPEGPMPPYSVMGPNMAIRTAVFLLGVLFDGSIGPRRSSYPMGSETELSWRLYRQGYKPWHVPSAIVEHFIRADQMRKSWVLERAIRYGRGRFRLRDLEKSGAPWIVMPQWFGVPRRFFREIFEEEIQVIGAWLSSNERKLFRARWKRNCVWGHVVEARLSYGQRGRGI